MEKTPKKPQQDNKWKTRTGWGAAALATKLQGNQHEKRVAGQHMLQAVPASSQFVGARDKGCSVAAVTLQSRLLVKAGESKAFM